MEDNILGAENLEIGHINVQAFHLLEDLDSIGNISEPRGLKCKEANLAELDIDPLYPIMDFKTRPFNWKYFAGELAWYLKQDPDIDFINNFSSFWKNIVENNKANSNYGNLILGIHPDTEIDETEFGGGVNQMEWVYNSLINDKDTRQAIGFFNSPHFQYPGNKDFVCTMYSNFWIRKDYLDMKIQMRSNDIFYGLSYDAPWFSSLHQTMHLLLKEKYPNLKLGMYYHCADNIHFYERHFKLVDEILDSSLPESTKLTLRKPLFFFNDDENLELSNESLKFIETVEIVLASGEIPESQIFWKTLLIDTLYDIE